MPSLQEFKCPCCGGSVEFDSSLQKLKCPYCDSEFEPDALREHDEELASEPKVDMNWESDVGSKWADGETDWLHTYICRSCGGEIVVDQNTAATSCPYCDNPVVLTDRLAGELRPDYVIPFKLDKNAAKAALNRHLSGKKLLPKVFKDQNHIDELKGIYVPFWLFDSDVDASIIYKATRVRHWSDRNYNYTETQYYSVSRAGTVRFEHIPVDGSSKMPDDLMQSIEPFDFSQAVDFKTAYLSGYLAEKYDVSAAESIEHANMRIKRSTEEEFAKTVNTFVTVTPEKSNIRLSQNKAKYTLYPVWILNTNWNGRKYTFAMNGQTGKFVGDLPVDKKAKSRMTLAYTAIIGAAAYAIVTLLHYLL